MAVGLLGAFVSRNNDIDGYWALGKLYEHARASGVYIHFNPVKHGHTKRVVDWPYLSFHRFVQASILPSDWAGDSGERGGTFGERV